MQHTHRRNKTSKESANMATDAGSIRGFDTEHTTHNTPWEMPLLGKTALRGERKQTMAIMRFLLGCTQDDTSLANERMHDMGQTGS